MGFTALIGRLLFIPVALSGVCLSLLFGVPMAGAMEPQEHMVTIEDSDGHSMHMTETSADTQQPECCATVRMEHDTNATTPGNSKTPNMFVVVDLSREICSWVIVHVPLGIKSLSHQPPHPQFSLIGTTIKRE